jgi:enolase
MMAKISKIHAREIIDSRGTPTIEVDIFAGEIMARAAVPSGASTGAHEALELRDGDSSRFLGKGVQKAIKHVNGVIAEKLRGVNVEQVDALLLAMDKSETKSELGANAILGVSLATAQLQAKLAGQMLFQTVSRGLAHKLPVPLMNVLNGGAHANNGLDVQEFMIVPVGFDRYSEALRCGSEIFHTLKKVLSQKHLSTAVGDEGGFAPKLSSNQEALDLLMMATEKAGYKTGEQVVFALDVAATELFQDGHYQWEGEKISATELIDVYQGWTKNYPLKSIEDGLSEDDWDGWKQITERLGARTQLVGDDLFVTNPRRLQRGIEQKVANALLVKVNQIGSLQETRSAVSLAQANNYKTVMSHRSGETEDVTIADLAVGLNCEQIKTGSLCRGERTAKYNQLLRIEEALGLKAQYWGRKAFG